MAEKPELIVFSQYKLGGVQNFYYNLLSNDPYQAFDKKWIFSDDVNSDDPKLPALFNCCEEIVFPLQQTPGEDAYIRASRLEKLISERAGAVLTNFDLELSTLHLHRRNNKTIFFICHDEWYLSRAVRFDFLIDVFIAHNIEFYNRLRSLLPKRKNDVYYLPYGVNIPSIQRKPNVDKELKIVIAARLQPEKGTNDLPVINRLLQEQGITVKWTIIGNGPEKTYLQQELKDNAEFFTFSKNQEVVNEMANNDIFILPSRLDGLPVAMLEAMSVGCVPVISKFNEGITAVVTNDIGYVLPVGDNNAFASAIAELHYNRQELETKSKAALRLINEKYEVKERSKEYFDLFLRYKELKKKKRLKIPNYGSGYLSHPWIPAIASKTLRKIRKVLSEK
ncbi:glycosyltransferase family 4 protein [Niastella caeni]|uniref:Glycosyltransferase family 4 protein n=1 Tax=Niastella caeni TaxID=2569763 RepID=A0A4S8I0P6_9BACT|nr:glycosyltransferase family 4 protein [Niastella caeni]THU41530.1 glycosyltransferase family 4 protein [Niastella caeni]